MTKDRPAAWVQVKDTFFLRITHIKRVEVERIQKKYRKIGFQDHQRVWDTDEAAVSRELMRLIVLDWRGLTYRIQRLILCQRRTPDSPPDTRIIEPKKTPSGEELSAESIQILLEMEASNIRFAQFLATCWKNFDEIFEAQEMEEEEPTADEKALILEEETKN